MFNNVQLKDEGKQVLEQVVCCWFSGVSDLFYPELLDEPEDQMQADDELKDLNDLQDALKGIERNEKLRMGGWGWGLDPQLFGEMSVQQKVVAVAFITRALLRGKEFSPPCCAWGDATIAAIFQNFQTNIEVEIEANADCTYRQIMWDLLVRDEEDQDQGFPDSPNSCDYESWERVMGGFAAGIVQDLDFQMIELHDCCIIEGRQDGYYNIPLPNCDNRTLYASIRYLLDIRKEAEKILPV